MNQGAGAVSSSYFYDGAGRRVIKVVGGSATVFVYDAAGYLIAEFGGTVSNGGTSYVTTDRLGSTRVVTAGANSPVAQGTVLA